MLKNLFKKDPKKCYLKQLKKHGDIITLLNLDILNDGDEPVYYVDETIKENPKVVEKLTNLGEEIYKIIEKANVPLRSKVPFFYGIKNVMNQVQYFVRIPVGKNGGCFNFADDYMKPLYEVSKILQKESDWVAMTDASCDVLDDLYDFVLTFVLKD